MNLMFILLFTTLSFHSQIANYVNNGGFEELALPQSVIPKYWCSADSGKYFGELLIPPQKVPLSSYAFQWPRHGKNHFITTPFCPTCGANKRGFPKNRLKNNLQAGRIYCVSLYVNLSNQSTHAVDRIGIYFGDSSIDTITQCTKPITYLTPQVENPVNNIITDTLNWVLIRGYFVASGTEKYLLIGNFYSDTNTNKLLVNPTNLPGMFSDYLIDDVSVIDEGLPAYAGADKAIVPGDSVFIGREPDVGIDEACVWYELTSTTSSVAIDTVAGLWVKPITTATYIVKQDICGNVKWDTVVIHLNPVGISERLKIVNEELRISPVPATDYIEISIRNEFLTNEFKNLEIFNSLGQTVREEEISLSKAKTTIQTKDIPNGIYLLLLKSNSLRTVSKRFVIER